MGWRLKGTINIIFWRGVVLDLLDIYWNVFLNNSASQFVYVPLLILVSNFLWDLLSVHEDCNLQEIICCDKNTQAKFIWKYSFILDFWYHITSIWYCFSLNFLYSLTHCGSDLGVHFNLRNRLNTNAQLVY